MNRVCALSGLRALALAASLVGASTALGQDLGNLADAAVGLPLSSRPIFAACPPGEPNRMMIVLQSGIIRVVENGVLLPTPFLDISGPVIGGDASACGTITADSEQGLLGLAFDPDYANNRRFFLNYVVARGSCFTSQGINFDNGRTIIARFTTSANPNIANATPTTILQYDQPETNHNGGCLQFGPDGFLYIAAGDGGGGNDQHGSIGNGQLTTTNLGKLLRIDVSGALYTSPPTNPFVGVAGNDEIYCFGLRNPWRFSFDRLTGDLYINDVGQDVQEEVDFVPAGTGAGRNFGWRCREGTRCTGLNGGTACPSCTAGQILPPPANHTPPVYTYTHGGGTTQGFSTTGGYVYRGNLIPKWRGRYFFADYVNSRVWSIKMVAGAATDFQDHTTALTVGGAITSFRGVSSFGVDADGELYLCTFGNANQSIPCRVLKVVNQFNPADWNLDGVVNSNDVSFLLNNFFADLANGTFTADFNGDGEVNSNDTADFLNVWFLNVS